MRIRDIGKELSLDAAYEIDPEKKYILAFKNPLDMNLQHFMVKDFKKCGITNVYVMSGVGDVSLLKIEE